MLAPEIVSKLWPNLFKANTWRFFRYSIFLPTFSNKNPVFRKSDLCLPFPLSSSAFLSMFFKVLLSLMFPHVRLQKNVNVYRTWWPRSFELNQTFTNLLNGWKSTQRFWSEIRAARYMQLMLSLLISFHVSHCLASTRHAFWKRSFDCFEKGAHEKHYEALIYITMNKEVTRSQTFVICKSNGES